MNFLVIFLLLSQVIFTFSTHQADSQSITVLTPQRCPQGGSGIPPVTICSFIPSGNQQCCGTDPPLDNLENLCPTTSTTLTSTESDRRSCRSSFLSYWCMRSCVRTTASICSQAFTATVTACSSACPDMMGILLPTSATSFLGSSASTSTCSSYTYAPATDTAAPTVASFTANYLLIPAARQAQLTYSISVQTTNVPEAILSVVKEENGVTTTILSATTLAFSSWKYVPATSTTSAMYTTTYPVLVDSNLIPYGVFTVTATLNVHNSVNSVTSTVNTQLHTMTPTPTPTRRITRTSTVTPVPFQCPDPALTPGNTIVPVRIFTTTDCSGTPAFTLSMPLNYGSSWCYCFTAGNNLYSATNFKCDTTGHQVTFSVFTSNYLCSIQSILYSSTAVGTSCGAATFLGSVGQPLYAQVANFTPCAGWTRSYTLPIQVSAADFNQALISVIGFGSLVDLTALDGTSRSQIVKNILSEGTQVMTSDARIEAIIDCRYLPVGTDGALTIMQRTPSTPTSRIRSLGSTCSTAVVVAVDPTKIQAQLNMTLPAYPFMPNYTLTWMTDVIYINRFDSSGGVIHNDVVTFDVSCSSPLFLHFCRFDRGNNYCNLVTNPIVQNGKGWCTVTSPYTSAFIGFQALPQVSEQTSIGQRRMSTTSAMTTMLVWTMLTLCFSFVITTLTFPETI